MTAIYIPYRARWYRKPAESHASYLPLARRVKITRSIDSVGHFYSSLKIIFTINHLKTHISHMARYMHRIIKSNSPEETIMKLNTKTGLTLLVFSLIALSPGQALAHYWGNGYRHSPVTPPSLPRHCRTTGCCTKNLWWLLVPDQFITPTTGIKALWI